MRTTVSTAFRSDVVRAATDAQVVESMDAAGELLRLAEALVAEAAGEIDRRSDSPIRSERMTTALGCRDARELVQRVTRVSGRRAADLVKAARATAPAVSTATGETLSAADPAMRQALAAGAVGADAVVAVSSALDAATVSYAHRAAADRELAAAACGEGADGGGLPCADDLRMQAQVWALYLDPDGAEPRADHAERRRGLTLGVCRDGLVPVRGNLLPEVAAQLKHLDDAVHNPRASSGVAFGVADPSDDGPLDLRTHPQRLHDTFGMALTIAARSGDVPTIGGSAPTLLVSVRHEDLASGRGAAHIDGIDEPVPLSVARHVACTGAMQRVVFDEFGRIARIETLERTFNHYQRKAITLRDGTCIIPGCDVPAAWCEIHHVTEHAKGGATTTDNGVLLCWHHHRTLDRSGWHIRMRCGVPEVRGPSWWDASLAWRHFIRHPHSRPICRTDADLSSRWRRPCCRRAPR